MADAETFPFRILVVDDEEAVLTTTAAILRDAGYIVNTAHEGFEALAALRRGVPELLISDLHMPGMSGFELLGVIRKRFPSMAVIAISGQFTPISFPAGILADHFLPKGDVPVIELLEVVRQLTSEGPPRSQPAKSDLAPAWVPRSSRGYVVLTCPHCLRSSSVPSNEVGLGKTATETCLHCGTKISYCVDPKVLPEPPSSSEAARDRVELSKKLVESSQNTIEQIRRVISGSRRKNA